MAGRPLHPELEHLEHVFDVFARRAPEPALLQTWYARVRHSLTRGRARARWVEIFGQALADLASAQAPPEEPPTQELLAAYLRPGLDPAPYAEALREAVATIERPALAWMHSAWTDDTETCPLRRRVEVHELTAALARITSDTCRPSDLRAQAERFTQEGALEWCRALLAPGARASLTEALLHWPITAGGLGLRHAHVEVARLQRAWSRLDAVPAPAERSPTWEVRDRAWGRFYAQWLGCLEGELIAASPQMEALITDFIQRGSEVGGRHQRGLSPYWRAIVLMYGPAILERFGTFRFLLTELVPLRLITHGDAGLDDDLGPAPSGSGSDHVYDDRDIPF